MVYCTSFENWRLKRLREFKSHPFRQGNMLEEQKIQINNDKRQSDLEEMRSLARKLLESFKNESKEFLKEKTEVLI